MNSSVLETKMSLSVLETKMNNIISYLNMKQIPNTLQINISSILKSLGGSLFNNYVYHDALLSNSDDVVNEGFRCILIIIEKYLKLKYDILVDYEIRYQLLTKLYVPFSNNVDIYLDNTLNDFIVHVSREILKYIHVKYYLPSYVNVKNNIYIDTYNEKFVISIFIEGMHEWRINRLTELANDLLLKIIRDLDMDFDNDFIKSNNINVDMMCNMLMTNRAFLLATKSYDIFDCSSFTMEFVQDNWNKFGDVIDKLSDNFNNKAIELNNKLSKYPLKLHIAFESSGNKLNVILHVIRRN